MANNLSPHQLRALIQDFYLQNDQEKIYKGMDFNGLVKWTQANGLHKLNEMLQLQYGKQINPNQQQNSVPIAMGQTNPNKARDRFKRLSRAVDTGSTQLQQSLALNKEMEKELRQKLVMFYTVVDESKLSMANKNNFEKAIRFALTQGIQELSAMLYDTYGMTLEEGCEEFAKGRKVLNNADDSNKLIANHLRGEIDKVRLGNQLKEFLQFHGDTDNLETVDDMCDWAEEKGIDILNRYLFENYGQSLEEYLQEHQELDESEDENSENVYESEEEIDSLPSEELDNGVPFEDLTDNELLEELIQFYKKHDMEHYEATQDPVKKQQLIQLARSKGRVELNRVLFSLYQAIVTPIDHPRPKGLGLTLARPPKSPSVGPPMPSSPRPQQSFQPEPNLPPRNFDAKPPKWSDLSSNEESGPSLPPSLPQRTGRPLPPFDTPSTQNKKMYQSELSSVDKGSQDGPRSITHRKPNDLAYGRMNQDKIRTAQRNMGKINGGGGNQQNPFDFTSHTQQTVAGSVGHQSQLQYQQYEGLVSPSERVLPKQTPVAPAMELPPLQKPKKKQGFGARIRTLFRGTKKKQNTLAGPTSAEATTMNEGRFAAISPVSPAMGRPGSPSRMLPPNGIPQQNGAMMPYNPLPGGQQADYGLPMHRNTGPTSSDFGHLPRKPESSFVNSRPQSPASPPSAPPAASAAYSYSQQIPPQPYNTQATYSAPVPQLPPRSPRFEQPPSHAVPKPIPDRSVPTMPPRNLRVEPPQSKQLPEPGLHFDTGNTGRALPPISTFRSQEPPPPAPPGLGFNSPSAKNERSPEPCGSYVFDIMSGDCQNCRWPKHEHLKLQNRRNDRKHTAEGVNGIIDKFNKGKKKKKRKKKKKGQPKELDDSMFLLLMSKEAQAKIAT